MTVNMGKLAGEVLDLDSHHMILPEELAEIWGPKHRPAVDAMFTMLNKSHMFRYMNADKDNTALAELRKTAREDLWAVSGWGAHGAQNATDRLDVLDRLGIQRQLVFPTGMWSMMHSELPDAFEAISRYNDFILAWAASASADRLRVACLINTHDQAKALAEVDRCLKKGARLFQFACARPWAGLSLGAEEWHPLWARLAEARTPGLFHLGSQGNGEGLAGQPGDARKTRPESLLARGWGRHGKNFAFPPRPEADPTEIFGPYHMMTVNIGPELALMTMIFGGVFDKFPDLRWGVIEMGAEWVAPWCKRMDSCLDAFGRRFDPKLKMKPSDYVRRHIRVTPYYFEKVGDWIRQSGLEEVYVFSTDYPHPEGGRDPLTKFAGEITPLGEKAAARFFVENARDILPD